MREMSRWLLLCMALDILWAAAGNPAAAFAPPRLPQHATVPALALRGRGLDSASEAVVTRADRRDIKTILRVPWRPGIVGEVPEERVAVQRRSAEPKVDPSYSKPPSSFFGKAAPRPPKAGQAGDRGARPQARIAQPAVIDASYAKPPSSFFAGKGGAGRGAERAGRSPRAPPHRKSAPETPVCRQSEGEGEDENGNGAARDGTANEVQPFETALIAQEEKGAAEEVADETSGSDAAAAMRRQETRTLLRVPWRRATEYSHVCVCKCGCVRMCVCV